MNERPTVTSQVGMAWPYGARPEVGSSRVYPIPFGQRRRRVSRFERRLQQKRRQSLNRTGTSGRKVNQATDYTVGLMIVAIVCLMGIELFKWLGG